MPDCLYKPSKRVISCNRGSIMFTNPSNAWKPTNRNQKPTVLMEPIDDSSAWTREELKKSQAYIYRLKNAEVIEVLDAVDRVEAKGIDIKDIKPELFARIQYPFPGSRISEFV